MHTPLPPRFGRGTSFVSFSSPYGRHLEHRVTAVVGLFEPPPYIAFQRRYYCQTLTLPCTTTDIIRQLGLYTKCAALPYRLVCVCTIRLCTDIPHGTTSPYTYPSGGHHCLQFFFYPANNSGKHCARYQQSNRIASKYILFSPWAPRVSSSCSKHSA